MVVIGLLLKQNTPGLRKQGVSLPHREPQLCPQDGLIGGAKVAGCEQGVGGQLIQATAPGCLEPQ